MDTELRIFYDKEGRCWGAEILGLPGFVAAGDTLAELWIAVEDALKAWLDAEREEMGLKD